jgi:hypothetical protein
MILSKIVKEQNTFNYYFTDYRSSNKWILCAHIFYKICQLYSDLIIRLIIIKNRNNGSRRPHQISIAPPQKVAPQHLQRSNSCNWYNELDLQGLLQRSITNANIKPTPGLPSIPPPNDRPTPALQHQNDVRLWWPISIAQAKHH